MSKDIRTKNSGIFTNYVYKSIPLAFNESMSYYETLCYIVETLKKYDKILLEYDELIVKLEEYVNNYFDNLDLQEEVNKKLDEMVEDGTFDRLFSSVTGDLSNLNTSNKSNLVSAIDEVNSKTGTLSNLTTTSKSNLVSAINEVDDDIGNLSNLDISISNTNIVTAINSVNSKIHNNNYSTTEINTGNKWIDNKDIYRKVLTFNDIAPEENNAYWDANHNISNLDRVTKIEVYGLIKNSHEIQNLTNITISSSENLPVTCWNISVNRTRILISYRGSTAGMPASNGYEEVDIILEYTKTS